MVEAGEGVDRLALRAVLEPGQNTFDRPCCTGCFAVAEEAEADALGPRMTRLMWAMGTTALGALIWAERDRLSDWVGG